MNNKSGSFNLGNGKGFSVKEVIAASQRISGRAIKAVESGRRAGDPPFLISGSEKARTILNWKPKYYDLDSIIETAWKWHSGN